MKWLISLVLASSCTIAHAHSDRLSAPDHPKWKAECGSCHIAYPPQLLSAENWQRMMAELDRHFGENASMDTKSNKEILDFLQRHAGSARNSSASLRITDTPWFTREHRRISKSTWANPAVKSRANCTACHVDAERADWSEHHVRMPGGRDSMEPGTGLVEYRGEPHEKRHKGDDRD